MYERRYALKVRHGHSDTLAIGVHALPRNMPTMHGSSRLRTLSLPRPSLPAAGARYDGIGTQPIILARFRLQGSRQIPCLVP